MSIGFVDERNEFHTTTSHAPHANALPQLMRILTELMDPSSSQTEFVLEWNRDPEEFDFRFVRSDGGSVLFEVYQYPTDERELSERELVFAHLGSVKDVCHAFSETFDRLYEDRDTDEFEFNWRQPFPRAEFERFKSTLCT
jgi:hypothetical protein